jgi:hypothetical protein
MVCLSIKFYRVYHHVDEFGYFWKGDVTKSDHHATYVLTKVDQVYSLLAII